MTGNPECRRRRIRLRPAILAIAINSLCVIPAAGQYPASSLGGGQSTTLPGSVPSGPATDEVVQLTLRDVLKMALRYNLGAIESGQNAQIARGQRLLALSYLLPQVSAGASETVQQVNLATFGLNGLKPQGIPNVVGPFSYSSVDASVSQTLSTLDALFPAETFRSTCTP